MRYGPEDSIQYKIKFEGKVLSVQPRSNVWRYRLDNRTHMLIGYNVFLEGTTDENLTADGKSGEEKHKFAVAISEKQQEKLRFHIGDEITGTAWTKKYLKLEYADYYRAGALKKTVAAESSDNGKNPPWTDEAPALSVYDWRGCRMLYKRCWSSKSLDEHGWADVQNLIEGINKDGRHNLTPEQLEEIVRTDEKQRYSFNEKHTKMRANQGHSIPVDVELEKKNPPEILYHGTGEKYVKSID